MINNITPTELERRRKLSVINKGKVLSEEHCKKISLANLGKHHKQFSEESKKKMSQSKMGDKNPNYGKFGEQHQNWKGDDVSNESLHQWLRKHFPKPDKCQVCLKVPPRDLANITGIYNREFKNWAWFCSTCHHRFDNIYQKGWITRRKQGNENRNRNNR